MSNQQLQSAIDGACAKLVETAALMGQSLAFDLNSAKALEDIADALKRVAKGDKATLQGGGFLIGAYLGELIRRQIDGEWSEGTEGDGFAVVAGDFACYPIARVRSYIGKASGNSLVFFAQAAAAHRTH